MQEEGRTEQALSTAGACTSIQSVDLYVSCTDFVAQLNDLGSTCRCRYGLDAKAKSRACKLFQVQRPTSAGASASSEAQSASRVGRRCDECFITSRNKTTYSAVSVAGFVKFSRFDDLS